MSTYIGKERYDKQETGSTNVDIRFLAKQGASHGTVVTAQVQTQGRGRRGRSWESEEGTSLLFSVLLRPRLMPDRAPQITLLMAMAVAKAIEEIGQLEPMIKWPNDVVINGKKVCGVLTEMDMDAGAIDCVIVGTGVNVNQQAMPAELADVATSLYLEIGKAVNKESLLEGVLEKFENYYESFMETGTFKNLQKEYQSMLVSLDKEVKVLDPKGEYTGISRGIDEMGELLVELEDGSVVTVYAGEVSVRGLYGYA